ncbi:MAG: VOC family protein [Pseudomonadota bacterium]
MHLGAFSMSLAVKDLAASRSFYEILGFETMGGDAEHGWLILKQGTTVIGLFQGMFDANMLTFNPGWDQSAQPVDDFEDVRAIQSKLKEAGFAFESEADPDSDGPASFVVRDPDGNPVLVDQHVDRPD